MQPHCGGPPSPLPSCAGCNGSSSLPDLTSLTAGQNPDKNIALFVHNKKVIFTLNQDYFCSKAGIISMENGSDTALAKCAEVNPFVYTELGKSLYFAVVTNVFHTTVQDFCFSCLA